LRNEKRDFISFALNMSKNFALSQGLRTANTILEGVWKLDLNGDTRYPDYEMYVFYHKTNVINLIFIPKNLCHII
jgi:hypothetical protein